VFLGFDGDAVRECGSWGRVYGKGQVVCTLPRFILGEFPSYFIKLDTFV